MRTITITAIIVAVVAFFAFLMPMVIQNLRYSNFTISGTVVDEQGQPLDDVGVRITAGRSVKMGFESKNESRFDKVSGDFEYRFQNYSVASLRFFKEGFFDHKEQDWTRGGTHTEVRIVMRRKPATTQP